MKNFHFLFVIPSLGLIPMLLKFDLLYHIYVGTLCDF